MDGKQPGVEIDLGGLRMAADSLRHANRELDHGIRFGLACPGGQIAAAANLFGLALDRALGNKARQLATIEHIEHLTRQLDLHCGADAGAGGDDEAVQRMVGLHE